MKKSLKVFSVAMAIGAMGAFASCGSCGGGDADAIKLTVWVSEADKPFAQEVVKDFKAAHPDKKYAFTIDVQGENDVATRVLKDVENAADVYSYINDQISKLVNGDALSKIAGDRLTSIEQANAKEAVDSGKATVNGEEALYGIPYTDNTFFMYYNKSVLTEEDIGSIDKILAN